MARVRGARESILTVGAGGRGAIAAAVCALALGACGEDEPEGPSKAEYTRQANALCSENAEEIESINELVFEGKKVDTFEARFFVEELGPALDVLMVQLKQLDKPEEDIADAERLFSIYERLIADAKQAAKSDRGSLAFLAGIERRVELIDEAATKAGMPNCGGTA
jgi:hypothetical protein